MSRIMTTDQFHFRPLPKEDLIFSQRFVELLGSFVRTGTPSIEMGEDAGTFVWNRVLSTNATHLGRYSVMSRDLSPFTSAIY